MQHLPPQNLEAEEIILSAALLNFSFVESIVLELDPSDFYYPNHVAVWRVIRELKEKNHPVDFTSVWLELEKIKPLKELNNLLQSLASNISYVGYNYEIVCRELKEKATRRKYINILQEAIENTYDFTYNIQDILQETAEVSLQLAGKFNPPSEGINPVAHYIPEALETLEVLNQENNMVGNSTGILDLDKLTGGLPIGSITTFAGRPGSGKTTLALNLLYNAALKGKHVALFSLEMSAVQILFKLFARSNADINPKIKVAVSDLFRTRGLKNIDPSWLPPTTEAVAELNFSLDCCSNANVDYIRNQLGKLIAIGKKPDIVAIDYLGIMGASKSSKKYQNQVLELEETVRALRTLSKDLNISLIVLSQLNRGPEARLDKTADLTHFRSGDALPNEAALAITIYNPCVQGGGSKDGEPPDNILKLNIVKNRFGPTGEVTVGFDAKTGKIYDLY